VAKHLPTGRPITDAASSPGSKEAFLHMGSTDFLKLVWAPEDGVGSYLVLVHHTRRPCTYFGIKIILIKMVFLNVLFIVREIIIKYFS
jgi:hypothetical protein